MRAECLPSSSDSKTFQGKYVIDVLKEDDCPKDFYSKLLQTSSWIWKTTEKDSSMMGFAVVQYIHGLRNL